MLYNPDMSNAGQQDKRRPRTAVGRFLARQRASSPGRLEVAALLLLVLGGVPLLLVVWVVGVVLLWGSPRWQPVDKLVGTVLSGGLQVALYADAPAGIDLMLLLSVLTTVAWLWWRARVLPVGPSYTSIAIPAAGALGLAIFLGTVGYFFVGFGLATSCTDTFETGHGCDALHRWLATGVIGQIAVAVAAAALIIVAQTRPDPHRRLATISMLLIPLPVMWIIITSVFGDLSFARLQERQRSRLRGDIHDRHQRNWKSVHLGGSNGRH